MTAVPLAFGASLLFGLLGNGPNVEVMRLHVPKDCESVVPVPSTKHVAKSDRDVLVWRIDNDCGKAVDFMLAPKAAHPFACVGEKGANVGTAFPLKGKEHAFVICTVNYPDDDAALPVTYKFDADFALSSSVKSLSAEPEGSEIAIEVEP